MIATSIHDILLLALAEAYDRQTDAVMMLEQIELAVRKHERATPEAKRISNKTSSVIIELDTLGFIRIDRGRVTLSKDGVMACQDMELPAEWANLHIHLKPFVRKPRA